MPSPSRSAMVRSRTERGRRYVGDAVAQHAAGLPGALEHGDAVAAQTEVVRGREARRGPEPTTATRRPEEAAGVPASSGRSRTRSPRYRSTSRTDTASSNRPRLHSLSQVCGHTRPVTAGSALRASRRRAAPSTSPARSSSMYSGICTSPGQASVHGLVVTFMDPAMEWYRLSPVKALQYLPPLRVQWKSFSGAR